MNGLNKETGLSLLVMRVVNWFQPRDVIIGPSFLKGYAPCRIEKGGRIQIWGTLGRDCCQERSG